MGGLLGSITIPGNRLTDLVGQTSTVGRPIPFGYGKCRIVEPNVIWTAGIPKEHVRRKKQGKGGVKTEEFTYTLSYAIAFMAGPTYGYITIKRGGKVVYTTDPNSPIEDRAFAAKWLQKARLYNGTEEQMPDATIESYKGAGQVSAHRGLSYIVVTDDDVTAEGGSVPQYEAVILASPPEAYLTSLPYAQRFADNALVGFVPRSGGELRTLLREGLQEPDNLLITFIPLEGDLFISEPPDMEPDFLNISFLPTGGKLSQPPVGNISKEYISISFTPAIGWMGNAPLGNQSPDKLSVSFIPTGGTLNAP